MILFIGGYYLTDPDDSNSLRIAVIDEFKFNSDYFSDGQSQSEHRKRLIDSSGQAYLTLSRFEYGDEALIYALKEGSTG